MTKVRIVTDSTCYLPEDVVAAHGIARVSLSVTEPGRTERELDMDWPAFYRRLADSPKLPTTSQPPPADFAEVFEAALAADEQVCGVFLSSWMSGTFEGARSAADTVRASHPDAVIEVVDSHTCAMVLGLIILKVAEVAGSGGDAAACAEAARRWSRCGRWLILPCGLENLRKGGRIGGASALIGSALQIVPLITVEEGRVELLRRVRTRRRALAEAVGFFTEETGRLGLAGVCVQQVEDSGEAAQLAETLATVAGRTPDILPVGPVVGLHVGPATGIAYLTERPIWPE